MTTTLTTPDTKTYLDTLQETYPNIRSFNDVKTINDWDKVLTGSFTTEFIELVKKKKFTPFDVLHMEKEEINLFVETIKIEEAYPKTSTTKVLKFRVTLNGLSALLKQMKMREREEPTNKNKKPKPIHLTPLPRYDEDVIKLLKSFDVWLSKEPDYKICWQEYFIKILPDGCYKETTPLMEKYKTTTWEEALLPLYEDLSSKDKYFLGNIFSKVVMKDSLDDFISISEFYQKVLKEKEEICSHNFFYGLKEALQNKVKQRLASPEEKIFNPAKFPFSHIKQTAIAMYEQVQKSKSQGEKPQKVKIDIRKEKTDANSSYFKGLKGYKFCQNHGWNKTHDTSTCYSGQNNQSNVNPNPTNSTPNRGSRGRGYRGNDRGRGRGRGRGNSNSSTPETTP